MLFIYLFISPLLTFMSVLQSTFPGTSRSSLHLLTHKIVLLLFTQFPAFSLNFVTVSLYIVVKKLTEINCANFLLSFMVFQSWEYREKFLASKFDVNQFLLGVRWCPNDAAKEVVDVMQYKADRRKNSDCFLFPKVQKSCDAEDWNSADLTVFASVTGRIHLWKERQTSGRAGQVSIPWQECAASQSYQREPFTPVHLRDECNDIQHSVS